MIPKEDRRIEKKTSWVEEEDQQELGDEGM